jgi:cytochrome P450
MPRSAVAPSRRRPPGPREPVAVADIRRDPLGFLRETTARYGDVARHVTLEGDSVVIVNRADLARSVLRERRRVYVKRGTPDDQMLTPLLGEGLLTSEGEMWQRQRRTAQPAFARRRIAALDGLIVEQTLALLERWKQAIADGSAVRLDHDLSSLTLAVVAQAILGSGISNADRRFGRAVDTVNRFMGHYDPLEPTAEGARARAAFSGALAFLDGLVRLIVQARRAEGTSNDPDLLDRLLADGYDDRSLRDQVLTVLMAGHETTAKALTWASYLLACHPEVGARLDRELAVALDGREPTAEDLAAAPLCRDVMREAMRLYPPVWLLSRRATRDDELGGFHIAGGTLVCVSPYLLHRHPDYWDAPESFNPDRFADGDAETRRPDFAYIPFSGGPRRCIGETLALLEAQLVLATLRQRVDIRLVPGHPVEPEALVTLRPREGLIVTLARRGG